MKRFLPLCLVSIIFSASMRGQLTTSSYKVEVTGSGPSFQETFSVKRGMDFLPALAVVSPVHIVTGKAKTLCIIHDSAVSENTLVVRGTCGDLGSFEQRFASSSESDVLEVSTRVILNPGITVHSVEDRYSFLPKRNSNVNELRGPLDFVWSQNIKREKDDLIPEHDFKSPALMMQQGPVFAAILPEPSSRHIEPLALDLDVTSETQPWMSYGAVTSKPHDHSYFRRAGDATLRPIANTIEYRYALVLSAQPTKQGYRRVTHLLWERLGHPALLEGTDAQQNALRPELASFQSWRQEAWHSYADRVYKEFPCGQRTCGTLMSNRNYKGDWQHPEPDAWFNAWFQTLRTAYGWYMHGRAAGDPDMMRRAENVLNLALTSPQKHGAFSTIYLLDGARWIPGDGWASYPDSYHAFSMSWTAYWMLRWAEDLTPARRDEVLRFVRPYGEFLLAHQQANGVIPSWYYADTLEPRTEFRDFNAETAPSALLLAELGSLSGDTRFTSAAERAMNFVEQQVLPRQRWFDFETYLSCARKDFNFFDSWTAQYPQNNLAEMQAPQAMLALFKTTHDARYLASGERMLDYLLLTQQVWPNPEFTPMLLGGFTTQNTDAEWSDARQSYAATLLLDFYNATGNADYLERAIAAARSTFAVAPWENWAHTGYSDEPGALTGFHWGTGSAMTSVEIMTPELGDALIDVKGGFGVGFDQSTVRDVSVHDTRIDFTLSSPNNQRHFLVRFRGVDPQTTYIIRWNNESAVRLSGKDLLKHGISIAKVAQESTL